MAIPSCSDPREWVHWFFNEDAAKWSRSCSALFVDTTVTSNYKAAVDAAEEFVVNHPTNVVAHYYRALAELLQASDCSGSMSSDRTVWSKKIVGNLHLVEPDGDFPFERLKGAGLRIFLRYCMAAVALSVTAARVFESAYSSCSESSVESAPEEMTKTPTNRNPVDCGHSILETGKTVSASSRGRSSLSFADPDPRCFLDHIGELDSLASKLCSEFLIVKNHIILIDDLVSNRLARALTLVNDGTNFVLRLVCPTTGSRLIDFDSRIYSADDPDECGREKDLVFVVLGHPGPIVASSRIRPVRKDGK